MNSWKQLSLTVKTVLITLIVGFSVWGIMDLVAARRIGAVAYEQIRENVKLQTIEGRLRFDGFLKAHFYLTEIIASNKEFSQYVGMLCRRNTGEGDPESVRLQDPPSWLPNRSIMRMLVNPSFYLVFGDSGKPLEYFSTFDDEIPAKVLMPDSYLLQASHNENFVTDVDGVPYVVSSKTIDAGCGLDDHHYTLTLASPINDELLVSLLPPYESNQIVALVTGLDPHVLASSDVERIRNGTRVKTLASQYLVSKETIYNYEYSDILITYAHFLPITEINAIIDEQVARQRLQILIICITYLGTIIALITWITRRIQRVTLNIVEFSERALGSKVSDQVSRDQLDILEQRYHFLTQEVVRNKTDLETTNRELKETQAKVLHQEKMASIGQLAAGVAHEINNPMGFINSNLQTLRKYLGRLLMYLNGQEEEIKRLGDQEATETLKKLKKSEKIDFITEDIKDLIGESLDGVDRVTEIVKNLKSFSHVDKGEAMEPADLNDCLDSTINIVWNELKYKCQVIKEYSELPMLNCHANELNQVFMNLLVNAAQAIEDKGEIRIRTEHVQDRIVISITDTGCGIDAEYLGRIFDPFFTTKEVGKGTGLGLSISYDIVKKHGGALSVESEPGRGTTFTIELPVG